MNSSTVPKTGGNTKPQPSNSKVNKKFRKIVFTLNNWSDSDYDEIVKWCNDHKYYYIIGKEIGDEKKTPHLQGYVDFTGKQVYFTTLKKLNAKMHFESAKGTRDDNVKYCSKEGDFETNIKLPRTERILKKHYSNVKWYPWQQQIIDIVESPEDDRTVNWIQDRDGYQGKSFLVKYLVCKYHCILGDGKKADVNYQIAKFQEEMDPLMIELDLVLLDIPRYSKEYVNYGLLEKVKDGVINSGKYEGKQILLDPIPHVFVFSNAPPNLELLTADRWNIINLDPPKVLFEDDSSSDESE